MELEKYEKINRYIFLFVKTTGGNLLHYSCLRGDLSLTKHLLEIDSKALFERNDHGVSPIEYIFLFGHHSLLSAITKIFLFRKFNWTS